MATLTLNQVLARIKRVCEAHRMVRKYAYGRQPSDFLDPQKKPQYPAILVNDTGGSLSIAGKATTLTFSFLFVDMVHVANETNVNEEDVLSDMVSVAMDVIAQLAAPEYFDWKIETSGLNLRSQEFGDMVAGVEVTVSISFFFTRNRCQIPTDLIDYTPTDTDMKPVYDIVYTATGSEGTTFSVGDVVGKKILLVIREGIPIYKTSSNPDTTQYVWDNTNLQVAFAPQANERFLILYRNY